MLGRGNTYVTDKTYSMTCHHGSGGNGNDCDVGNDIGNDDGHEYTWW